MSERLFGALLLAFSIAGIRLGWDLQAPISYEPIGPKAFPLLVLSLLAVCAVALLFDQRGGTTWPPRPVLMRIGFLFLVLLGYALLFERLGFIVATAVATVPVALAFGGNWKQSAMSGVGLGLGLFVLFDKLLDVVLPAGTWLKWLGQ